MLIPGIIVAGAGVVCARIVPNYLDKPSLKLAAYMLGVALALSGLALILYGMRRPSS